MLTLVLMARDFPRTARLWEAVEERLLGDPGGKRRKGGPGLASVPAAAHRAGRSSSSPSACAATAAIASWLAVSSAAQAAAGTLFTAAVDFRYNDTASLVGLDRFFSRFAVGSHGFVAQVMDESFVVGIVTFLVLRIFID